MFPRARSGTRTRTAGTGQGILSPSCLPFHHSSSGSFVAQRYGYLAAQPNFVAPFVGLTVHSVKMCRLLVLHHQHILHGRIGDAITKQACCRLHVRGNASVVEIVVSTTATARHFCGSGESKTAGDEVCFVTAGACKVVGREHKVAAEVRDGRCADDKPRDAFRLSSVVLKSRASDG